MMLIRNILLKYVELNGPEVLCDNRIQNILTDSGYFLEYPRHRFIFSALIEYGFLPELLSDVLCESRAFEMCNIFMKETGFDKELCIEIFSSITGLSVSVFNKTIDWSPNLSHEEMAKYILQLVRYHFDKRIVIRDVSCYVYSIDKFSIVFEILKSSWQFDYEKENAVFITKGELNRCKSNEVSLNIWTRSGNDISTSTGYNSSSKIDFDWEDQLDTVSTEYETNYFVTDIMEFSIRINHPIYDISFIQIEHS